MHNPNTPSRLLALAAVALASGSIAQAAQSTFDSDTEGWSAIGDIAAPLTWSSTGGNPGGTVFIPDQAVGGVTFFVAPEAFLGNKSAAFGTSLRFDLKQVYPGSPSQFDDTDVALEGNGLKLVYDTVANPPNGSWASYAVPLLAGGWRVGSLSGALATDQQIQGVLSNVTALLIRAEYQTGSDTGYLDNVSLVPEPGSALMLAAGLGVLLGARKAGCAFGRAREA